MNFLLVIIFLSLYNSAFSQKEITVEEKKESIGNGRNNTLVLTLYEANVGDVEKAWKQEMKKNKAKVDMDSEIFADNAEIPSISANTLDVYAKVSKFGQDAVQMVVGFDMGGTYLNSSQHSSGYKAAKNLLYDFGVRMVKEAIGNQLDLAQKEVKKVEKHLEMLVRKNEKLKEDISRSEKSIEESKKRIEEAKRNIEINLQEQVDGKKSIEVQKKKVKEVEEKQRGVK